MNESDNKNCQWKKLHDTRPAQSRASSCTAGAGSWIYAQASSRFRTHPLTFIFSQSSSISVPNSSTTTRQTSYTWLLELQLPDVPSPEPSATECKCPTLEHETLPLHHSTPDENASIAQQQHQTTTGVEATTVSRLELAGPPGSASLTEVVRGSMSVAPVVAKFRKCCSLALEQPLRVAPMESARYSPEIVIRAIDKTWQDKQLCSYLPWRRPGKQASFSVSELPQPSNPGEQTRTVRQTRVMLRISKLLNQRARRNDGGVATA